MVKRTRYGLFRSMRRPLTHVADPDGGESVVVHPPEYIDPNQSGAGGVILFVIEYKEDNCSGCSAS